MIELIIRNDLAALKELIRKGGVDRCRNGYTLLTAAVKHKNEAFVRYLLELGADIDKACYKAYRRTPIMLAAAANLTHIGKLLMNDHPDLKIRDAGGENAFEIALRKKHEGFIREVLQSRIGAFGGTDGPYVRLDENYFHALYFRKSASGRLLMCRQSLPRTGGAEQRLSCFAPSGELLFDFPLRTGFSPEPAIFPDQAPVFAVSDIEGEYEALVRLLKAGGVVNDRLEWTFGNGHLVVLGDLFDRAGRVTECLWLIYKLEEEARGRGGRVHMILGNHEEMNLWGDLRYVNSKYLANARLAGLPYTEFFERDTLLGQWLRCKHTLLRIGSCLFCHAGISPAFLKLRLDIQATNDLARSFLDRSNATRRNNPKARLLFSDQGPFWYRGLAREAVTDSELTEILSFYKVDKMIIGHTAVDQIKSEYRGRVILLDVPHRKGPALQKALLIDGNQFHEVNVKGERRLIN